MYDKYETKTDAKVTVLHVCSSHFIKTVIQKRKKYYPKKEQKHIRSIATSLIVKIIHCKCVSDAAEVYIVFIRLLRPVDSTIIFFQRDLVIVMILEHTRKN